MSQGGHSRKSVCMREYSVMCMSFSSVTVSQRGCRGSTAGQGTSAYCRQVGSTVKVYSKSTVSLQLVNGVQGGLQSTVEAKVYSSLGNSLYCRLWGVYSKSTVGLQLVVGIPLTVDCRL